jgi:hypothetical protein
LDHLLDRLDLFPLAAQLVLFPLVNQSGLSVLSVQGRRLLQPLLGLQALLVLFLLAVLLGLLAHLMVPLGLLDQFPLLLVGR